MLGESGEREVIQIYFPEGLQTTRDKCLIGANFWGSTEPEFQGKTIKWGTFSYAQDGWKEFYGLYIFFFHRGKLLIMKSKSSPS